MSHNGRVATTPTPRLASIQVGLPREHANGRAWTSAIFKSAVAGPVWLARENLHGDRQADPVAHGGPDKALLAYSAAHYAGWRAELPGRMDEHGAFGENLTVIGLTEESVHIGDVYALGEARVQVSQPRGPCWKLARRWGIPDLARRVLMSGRTGWYLRVLNEGLLAAGMEMRLLERPHPEWSVARVTALMRDRPRDEAAVAELARCPALAGAWRRRLDRYMASGAGPTDEAWLTEQPSTITTAR
jgi:MOSC domain-containing protein YiiM